ncbi:MAG: hypothetical protein ACTSRA_00380 [Promethearchaeota archaeon]|nr:MAG: hypothetical protein [Helarchaeota virus Nidhogg Meg22_1012]URC17411.1 MAG: hypothetical protein [Helarchaeota virus Nidhogg Meg22_1214]
MSVDKIVTEFDVIGHDKLLSVLDEVERGVERMTSNAERRLDDLTEKIRNMGTESDKSTPLIQKMGNALSKVVRKLRGVKNVGNINITTGGADVSELGKTEELGGLTPLSYSGFKLTEEEKEYIKKSDIELPEGITPEELLKTLSSVRKRYQESQKNVSGPDVSMLPFEDVLKYGESGTETAGQMRSTYEDLLYETLKEFTTSGSTSVTRPEDVEELLKKGLEVESALRKKRVPITEKVREVAKSSETYAGKPSEEVEAWMGAIMGFQEIEAPFKKIANELDKRARESKKEADEIYEALVRMIEAEKEGIKKFIKGITESSEVFRDISERLG